MSLDSETQGFEPFLDWGEIDKDMADDLHEAMVEYRVAQNIFIDENTIENAKRVMKAQHQIGAVAAAIQETIYTQPVMVHVAGKKKSEVDDSGHETIMQRCTRCGSTLSMWHENFAIITPEGPRDLEEDDVPWWDEGMIVAKHHRDGAMGMYPIEKGEDLKKHEHMCVDMSGLIG